MAWNPTIIGSEILAVHAALVPSGDEGEVVLFGGDEHWSDQQESAGGGLFKKTRIYDVRTHTIVPVVPPSPDSDVFCSHHAFAADGRLLIAGGTAKWPEGGDAHGHGLDFLGHNRCWLYNPRGRTWVETARLNRNPDQPDEERSGGRWYPGLVTLGSGDVAAFFGHLNQMDFRHRNTLPERYNQPGNVWVNLPKEMAFPIEPGGSVRYLFYARAFLLPDGKLFFATPMPVEFETAASGDGTYFSTRYNPVTGNYEGHKIPEPSGYSDWSRPAVLLPLLPEENYRPRVLFCGAIGALKIDLDPSIATPQWQNTSPRAAAVSTRTRTYSNAVILPNGEVCVVGGMHEVGPPEDPVLQTEIYSPGINWATGTYSNPDAWSVKQSAVHTRNYHSSALLLPNGKVWVAGGNVNGLPGNPNTAGVKQIELYEPDYIAVANRIQISQAPQIVTYRETFEIEIDRPATDVQRVALVRNGSATHSTNNDQRYVGLQINSRNGNTMVVTAPPHGNAAPPGYYMLWVIDNAGNPCQLAKFVRVAYVGCSVVTDRSTFSKEELDSLGGVGGQATFTNAIYVNFEGFIHTELTGSPSVQLTWADSGALISTADMTLVPVGRLLEVNPGNPDIPQRITYPFHVRFVRPNNIFGTFTDTRQVRATFTIGHHSCSQTLDLTYAPNPYMIDIDPPPANNPHWLSTDVRVFKIIEGETMFGNVTLGAGAPNAFIRGVLDKFNSAPNNGIHPFLSIRTDQSDAALDLASHAVTFSGFLPVVKPVYNFAVAKVRYRAVTTTAQRVKVFFRMFNTVGTMLEFNTGTTYRHHPATGGVNTVPLLGDAGGEIVSIPFFLNGRVETVTGEPGAASMTAQTLDPSYEIKDIAPGTGEVTMYFGCWLDINQTKKRFPINRAGSDGPWSSASCRSIQELARGRHQCLVAEIYFEPDAISTGETPGSSDNLSQRNLAILHSDNPGGPDSHTVVHTFEVNPSFLPALPREEVFHEEVFGVADFDQHSTFLKRGLPDELLFRWNNLPRDSEVTLYFSDIDTADIVQLGAFRFSPLAFTAVDKHTIRFNVSDVTWMPLPGGRATNIPALISIKLPDTVVYGQNFRVSVHQVSGRDRNIIGAFDINIPVSHAELILDEEVRTLSVMKHIATTIPSTNRWHPIFLRYLHFLSRKVDALGGNASTVHPNPDGSGRPYVPPSEKRPEKFCREGLLTSLVLALMLVLIGISPSASMLAVVTVVGLVLLVGLVRYWSAKCCGYNRCALLDYLAFGAAAASVALLILNSSMTTRQPFALSALSTAVLIAAICIFLSFVLRCRGKCCDDPDRDCQEARKSYEATLPR